MTSFAEFFEALHGVPPFPWQARLASELEGDSGWPPAIDLPTASGKTACLDIALYNLAKSRRGPRRIFYVVDRRLVVTAAFERSETIAAKLREADSGPLKEVADALRAVGGGVDHPLRVAELRGGVFCDATWIASPLQPMVITCTVDQIGSRLLFRGYGVSPSQQPIHAAMMANDALIFLDEAHCSRAFSQTMSAVEQYRSWGEEPIDLPFQYVEMTATPVRARSRVFRLAADDRASESPLAKRLHTTKPVRLERTDKVAKLAGMAEELAQDGRSRVAVMVNRIATARVVFNELRRRGRDTELVIGRIRPIDRDDQLKALRSFRSGTPRQTDASARFVVATQTLEVGADLDFDAIVSECASIDALQQRFGRLDRLGEMDGAARGAVIALGNLSDDDPIYGSALAKTWRWLETLETDGSVNFGVLSRAGHARTVTETLESDEPEGLRRFGPSAPVLFPSHLDALAQTSPVPHVEPDVGPFLHGPQSGPADINVVWRVDLTQDNMQWWSDIVRMLPPTGAESMPARVWDMRAWMREDREEAPDADLEGTAGVNDSAGRQRQVGRRHVLIWRGNDTGEPTASPEAVQPGMTIVLPASDVEWSKFGHIPESGLNGSTPRDLAEQAAFQGRRRCVLRAHAASSDAPLFELAKLPDLDWVDLVRPALIETLRLPHLPDWRREVVEALSQADEKQVDLVPYPDSSGWLLALRAGAMFDAEAGADELLTGSDVALDAHTKHVCQEADTLTSRLLPAHQSTVRQAAIWHDSGKADLRFQALLRHGDRLAAEFSPVLLAKSSGRFRRGEAGTRAGLPEKFRHEQLSLLLADAVLDGPDRDLVLHLIGSHHGRCRPFAEIVIDPNPEPIEYGGARLSRTEVLSRPAHRLDFGVTRRFWSLTRRYGWWGLPFLESMLRLADWEASRKEQGGQYA